MSIKRRYKCALDIGSTKIVAVIAEIEFNDYGDCDFNIIGFGESESDGINSGMVTNIDALSKAIRNAVSEAEKNTGYKVEQVILGITGNHIKSRNAQSIVKVQEDEITQFDIDRAIDATRIEQIPMDSQILHTVVQEFIVDDQSGIRDPIGMNGTKLETKVHVITGSINAINNLEKCVNKCGLTVEKIYLNPLASSYAVLSNDEKELGVCCVDFGKGTMDIAVFVNGSLRHTAIFPFAGDLITKDLAQALRTPHKEAELIKVKHGIAIQPDIEYDNMIEVPSVGDRPPRQIARSTLAKVIELRTDELLNYIFNELEEAGFTREDLTSGFVFTGGTSLLNGLVELVENKFDLPARVGNTKEFSGVFHSLHNPKYATAIGLLLMSIENNSSGFSTKYKSNNFKFVFFEKIKDFFNQF